MSHFWLPLMLRQIRSAVGRDMMQLGRPDCPSLMQPQMTLFDLIWTKVVLAAGTSLVITCV